MVLCIIQSRCITKSTMLKKSKTWTKFPASPVTITPFTMRCRQLISIAAMCQQSRECMRTLRQDAKRIMCATMGVKGIKVPPFCAQTARFSIKRNSHAIGGTTLTAHKHKISISKFSEEICRTDYSCGGGKDFEFQIHSFFQFERWPRTQSVLSQEEGRRFTSRQICDQRLNCWIVMANRHVSHIFVPTTH